MLSLVVDTLLLPPGGPFVLAAVGLAVARKRRRTGLGLVAAAGVLLVLLSTPLVAALLLGGLQSTPALDEDALARGADAIVVLGADVERGAPEYGGDATVGALTLERLRYGARLHRRTGAPLLVTGGSLAGLSRPLAHEMRAVLETDFGVPVRWVEPEARDTFENAARSRALFPAEARVRVLLVTHAWHMPRAAASFAAQGFDVVPAPTIPRAAPRWEVAELLPSSKGLRQSSLALHEWVGRLWYRARRL